MSGHPIRRPGPRRIAAASTAVVLSFLSLLTANTPVLADGLLPPQPYHYLHPPPSLAGSNNPPTIGETGVPLVGGRQTEPVSFFTRDGQFGIDVNAGTFDAPASANTVRLRIEPVNTPAGLPNGLSEDGNAYRVSAVALPSNAPVSPAQSYGVILRWPRLPTAIYVDRGGAWTVLCTARQWEISTSTVLCRTRTLGTFLAVRPGPLAPTSSSSPLQRLLPFILVAIVVGLAAVGAGFVMSRRGPPEHGGGGTSARGGQHT